MILFRARCDITKSVGTRSSILQSGTRLQPPVPPHVDRGLVFLAALMMMPHDDRLMGGWFWLLALGLFLVLIGLYLHWSVVLLGALLPFVPVVAEWLRRRRR